MTQKSKHCVMYKSGEVIFIDVSHLEESWHEMDKNDGFKTVNGQRIWKTKTVFNGNWKQFVNVCQKKSGGGQFELTNSEMEALRIDEGYSLSMYGVTNAKSNVVHFGNPNSVFELSFGMDESYYQPKRFQFKKLRCFIEGNKDITPEFANTNCGSDDENEDLDLKFDIESI